MNHMVISGLEDAGLADLAARVRTDSAAMTGFVSRVAHCARKSAPGTKPRKAVKKWKPKK